MAPILIKITEKITIKILLSDHSRSIGVIPVDRLSIVIMAIYMLYGRGIFTDNFDDQLDDRFDN